MFSKMKAWTTAAAVTVLFFAITAAVIAPAVENHYALPDRESLPIVVAADVFAPGDSVTGTFASSTATQVSATLLAQVGDNISISLTAVTASSTAIVLESRVGGGAAWTPIKTYSTAASVSDTINNDFGTRLFLRLRANSIPSADTVTYALTRVIASRTIQQWLNNNGLSVLRITDVGIETPNVKGGTVTGTADTAVRVRNGLVIGTHLTGATFTGAAADTIRTDATASSTASTIVARDAARNFSADSITAHLVGRADSATGASRAQKLTTARLIGGTSFDGTGNIAVALATSSTSATLADSATGAARAPAGTLTGTVLKSTVVTSSLTAFGALQTPVAISSLLVNSWTDQNSSVYWKDSFGIVHARGGVGGGSSGTVAFTLPVGYRPTVTTDFPSFDSVGPAVSWIRVGTDGTVTITGGVNNVRLTAIYFRTDQ